MLRSPFCILFLIALVSGNLVAAQPIRVACLGDSITEGTGAGVPWPTQLQTRLGNEYEVRNFGVGAATLLANGDKPYVLQQAYQDAIQFSPDIVIVILGTNDSKANNAAQARNISRDLASLLKPFRSKRATVFCCTPPVVNQGQWGIDPNLLRTRVAPAIRAACKATRVTLIDLHTAFEGDNRNLWTDGGHLNQAGSDLVAETASKAIQSIQ